MTKYDSTIKNKAFEMRENGFSLGEISKKLKIAKSTCSLWLNTTTLNETAKRLIQEKILNARKKGLLSIKIYRANKNLEIKANSLKIINSLDLSNKNLCKVLCSLLYWGEGSKTGYRTAFINSDPVMIRTFLRLLRMSYDIDESKFRGLVHIHEYHNDSETKLYWSKITSIPLTQFTKSYLKPHTKKVLRPGYKGALSVCYYDSSIVNELKAIYNTLSEHIGM